MPDKRISIKFEREDGSTYVAELPPGASIALAEFGQVVTAADLCSGDEIESIYSLETGGRGHRVI